ncbi:hypothetical protein Droror1_Dr00004978, partial [Drosera rotundifolia]
METKLLFSADNPPLSVIAAAKVTGIEAPIDASLSSGSEPSLVFSDRWELRGAPVLLRYIGHVAKSGYFNGRNSVESGK